MRRKNYIEQMNPLRNLAPAQVVSLIEAGMRGEFTLLQWYYQTIEQADPDLLALVERRVGAIQEMDWNIKEAEEVGDLKPEPDEGVEAGPEIETEVEPEAAARLRTAYEKIKNLTEAIGHLALATFRGYSICQLQDDAGNPAKPGSATKIYCIPHWNLLRDGRSGPWKLNPDALQTTFEALNQPELNADRDCLLVREVARPVDRVGLVKFIRSNYSQKAWADFVEKAAEDGVVIEQQQAPPVGKEQEYLETASGVQNGSNVLLAPGMKAIFSNAQRGPIPFEAHMRFLREQLVMAGTGGLLTMLAEPTGIGQGATGAHADAFRTLAKAEAKQISEVFQKGFDSKLTGGDPTDCYFELAYNEETDAGAIIDHALKLSQAGYEIDAEELSEKTGYKLTKKAKPDEQNPLFGGGAGFLGESRAPSSFRPAAVSFNRAGPDPAAAGAIIASARSNLAEAQHKDLAPLARPLLDLYRRAESNEITDEQLGQELLNLRDRLPAILAEINARPAVAKVMEQMMAKAFEAGRNKPPA